MTPKTITPADDVFEQLKKRAEAEGVTVEKAVNESVLRNVASDRYELGDPEERKILAHLIEEPGAGAAARVSLRLSDDDRQLAARASSAGPVETLGPGSGWSYVTGRRL